MPLIQTSLADKIGTIAFDHDDKRNALGADLIAEMIAALESFKADGVRVVVLRSASGGKVWSAGHDVGELPKADVDPLPYSDPLEQLLRAVKAFPAPVIAMVHGFMSRLPLTVAKEMFFSANLIPAERAERVGIVNRVVPAAELEAETYALARTIASRSSRAIAASKEAMRVLSESVPINPATYEYLHGLRRDVYFGPDYHEGTAAFLEKRAPKF